MARLQAIFSSSLIILTFVLADAHPVHHAGKPITDAHHHVHHAKKPIYDAHHHVHHAGKPKADVHHHVPHAGKPITTTNAKGFQPGQWKNAHATFYGEADGSGTFEGACGYDHKDKDVYGVDTTALSGALFKNGEACGACYEIKCATADKRYCKPGQRTITVTATNSCPSGGLGWCNPPNEHFDLSQPAYLKIAEYKAGIVPVQYRRVPCKKQGGVRFKITGNPYFNMVAITNVGGSGDVTKVEVKVGNESWTALKRNWGQKWETEASLVGKELAFRITTSDGRTLISEKACPHTWQFDQVFEGKNFI